MKNNKIAIYITVPVLILLALGTFTFATNIQTNTSSNISTANFKYLTGSLYTNINSKLDNMSKTKLETLLTKINTSIENAKNANKKTALEELKTLIESKLGMNNGLGNPPSGSGGMMPPGGFLSGSMNPPPGGFGSGSNMGTPPGGFGSGGTAIAPPGTGTSNANVEIKASSTGLGVSGTTKTVSSGTYTSTTSDESAIAVTNSGTLTISNAQVTKSGDVSNAESSEFYGLNAGVIAKGGSTINISDSSVYTTSKGSNGIFSTANSTVNVSNVVITTTSTDGDARGLDATYGGTINATNVKITTAGPHSAAIATDRGEGNVNVDSGTLTTNGTDSPVIYSTGKFNVKNIIGNANNAEAAVIEGQNSISLVDSILTATKNWGVLIYQSFSGDAQGVGGEFNMEGGSLTVKTGPVFYSTNTTGYINLKNVKIVSSGSELLRAEANSRWGNTGSNGANVSLTADTQTLAGNVVADSISEVSLSLTNNSKLTGTINADKTAKSAGITLDSTSTWNVTGDSYVNTISANISGTSVTNITGNGHTVYYKSSENSSLGGKTYTLVNGGYLKAY